MVELKSYLKEVKSKNSRLVNNNVVTVINWQKLYRLLSKVNGATFAQFRTTTEPTLLKRNNPFYDKENKFMDVLKDSYINVLLDFDYQNNVTNARAKDAVEEAQSLGVKNEIVSKLLDTLTKKELKKVAKSTVEEYKQANRQWGLHLVNEFTDKSSRILILHKDKIYVQVRVLNTETPVYKHKNGIPFTEEEREQLEPFIRRPKANKRQEVSEENEVIVRDYNIETINEIHIFKETFYIR